MTQLGFDTFLLVGHDRGARVSHRLTKDHSDRVLKLATLDIIPTHKMFQIVNKEMATNTYHWFFLIQPYDFPERMIGASADYFIRSRFTRGANAAEIFPPEAVEEYARCFCDPAAIHATCEDYRAGASIDLVHDEADFDNKVTCPMLALWSETGYVGRTQDVLGIWKEYAVNVRGHSLPGGHFLAEELPDATYEAVKGFLLEGWVGGWRPPSFPDSAGTQAFPAKAGMQNRLAMVTFPMPGAFWIPAFAGKTGAAEHGECHYWQTILDSGLRRKDGVAGYGECRCWPTFLDSGLRRNGGGEQALESGKPAQAFGEYAGNEVSPFSSSG